SATAPTPRQACPRNVRRWMRRMASGVMGGGVVGWWGRVVVGGKPTHCNGWAWGDSLPSNRLVQIQDGAAHVQPRGQLGGRNVLRGRGVADRQEFLRVVGARRVLLSVLRQEVEQHPRLGGLRGAASSALERPRH